VRVAIVLDENNNIFVSSHTLSNSKGTANRFDFDPEIARQARNAPASIFAETGQSGTTFSSYTAVYAPTEGSQLRGRRAWVLYLEIDWSRQWAEDRARILLEVGAIWVGMILMCGFGYWFAERTFTRPIEQLDDTMKRFAEGDTSARATIMRTDEIGNLARRFNHLSDTVHRNQEKLFESNEHLRIALESQRFSEEKAAQTHRLLVDAVESLPVGFFFCDQNDLVVLFNSAYYNMLWGSRKDIVKPGMKFRDVAAKLFDVETPAYLTHNGVSFAADVGERLAQRRAGSNSFALQLEDGRYLHVEEKRTTEGGMVTIFTDETERRRANAFLQTSAEIARLAGWWLDPTSMRIDWSREASEVLGVDPAALPASTAADTAVPTTVHAKDWQALALQVREATQTGQPFDQVLRWARCDGDARYLRVIGRPDLTSDHCIGVDGAIQDITDIKRREIADRERDSLVAIGQLAGDIAHEINNQIHPIYNSAKLARRMLPAGFADIDTNLEIIQCSAWEMHDLVTKILAFARRGEEDRTVRPLRPLLIESLKTVQARLPDTVTLSWTISHGDEPVFISDSDLTQIVTNLIQNAAYAMEDSGAIQVTSQLMSVKARLPTHGRSTAAETADPAALSELFVLTVSDDGPGMDRETLNRAFEPFYSTKPSGDGIGLGLAIVKGIVDDLNGTIELESAPNQGCTVRIRLPRA